MKDVERLFTDVSAENGDDKDENGNIPFRAEAMGTVTELGTRGVLVRFVLSDELYESMSVTVGSKVKEAARLHNYGVKTAQRRMICVVESESTGTFDFKKYEDLEWDPENPWSVPQQKISKQVSDVETGVDTESEKDTDVEENGGNLNFSNGDDTLFQDLRLNVFWGEYRGNTEEEGRIPIEREN